MSVFCSLLSHLPVNSVKGTRKGIYYTRDAIDKSAWNCTKAVNPEAFPWSIALFLPSPPLNDSVWGSNGPDLLICAQNNHSELRVVGGY